MSASQFIPYLMYCWASNLSRSFYLSLRLTNPRRIIKAFRLTVAKDEKMI